MPTPSELVTEAFATAQSYASNAQGQLTSFLDDLRNSVTITPLVDITFDPVAGPGTAAAPIYIGPAAYTSTLLTALNDAIAERMAGGTGISAAAEDALWDRARERELAAAQASIDQISRDAEALGYALPAGVMFDAIAREQRAYYDKASGLSRDIAVEQAKLEQINVHKAIEFGIQIEGAMADIVVKRLQPSVETYKADVLRYQAEIDQDVKHWEAQIKQNEAIITYTLNGQKLNADIARGNASALLEAGKVGAQVYSQLTASAYSMIKASAQVDAGSRMSVSYQYSNDTATAPPSITSV